MGANGAQAVRHHSWGNLNFSRTATGISKWFWVTIEGYLSYILPKFEHFNPTGLASGALYIHARIYSLHPVHTLSPSFIFFSYRNKCHVVLSDLFTSLQFEDPSQNIRNFILTTIHSQVQAQYFRDIIGLANSAVQLDQARCGQMFPYVGLKSSYLTNWLCTEMKQDRLFGSNTQCES